MKTLLIMAAGLLLGSPSIAEEFCPFIDVDHCKQQGDRSSLQTPVEEETKKSNPLKVEREISPELSVEVVLQPNAYCTACVEIKF